MSSPQPQQGARVAPRRTLTARTAFSRRPASQGRSPWPRSRVTVPRPQHPGRSWDRSPDCLPLTTHCAPRSRKQHGLQNGARPREGGRFQLFAASVCVTPTAGQNPLRGFLAARWAPRCFPKVTVLCDWEAPATAPSSQPFPTAGLRRPPPCPPPGPRAETRLIQKARADPVAPAGSPSGPARGGGPQASMVRDRGACVSFSRIKTFSQANTLKSTFQ